jgi:hypothetical protein
LLEACFGFAAVGRSTATTANAGGRIMRIRVLAFTIILSGVVAAQTTIPGTFNRTQPVPQQTNGGYIVSTPTISLGDGITPTVITNQDTVNVTLPQNTSLNGPTVQTNNPATLNTAANTTAASDNSQTAGQASRNFDFVKAPGGENSPVAGSMADDSVSLGEVARKVRNGKQISKRTITNADVNAMNGTFPGTEGQPGDATGVSGASMANPSQQNGDVTTPQTSGGTAGAAQPQNSQAPAYAQPSNQGPFGAPSTTPNDGTKPNAQQGPRVAPRSSSRPARIPAKPSSDKQQMPESSSALPLLGVLGSIVTLAGFGYMKLR